VGRAALCKKAQQATQENAAFQAARIQNYLQGKALLEAQLRQAAASKGLGAALAGLESLRTPPPAPRGVTASTQAGQSAWEQYRAGERNAEAIARAYQVKQSLQDWRAGERTVNAGEKHRCSQANSCDKACKSVSTS
jgi:hypothetical protein